MAIAKLYAFYEKNDIRMLDKYGNPVLLKVGCTTSATVQKRVAEQSKGTIVSDNVIVWGQNNDKIATWYDGRKDADKDFHNFIKIRKSKSHRPDVGSEVFEITVPELETLYQDFVKIHSNIEVRQQVYKVTLENSKIVLDKIFKEHCESAINQQILLETMAPVDNFVELRNDSLFLSKFSKLFAKTINELAQNPLSEPGLDIKLWDYLLDYKNKFIADSIANASQGKFVPKMDSELEDLYRKIERFRKQWIDSLKNRERDELPTCISLPNFLKCFSYIKGTVGSLYTGHINSTELKSRQSDYPPNDGIAIEILDPIKGLVEFVVFIECSRELNHMRYKGPAATDILFCKSAVNKFCQEVRSENEDGLWYEFKPQISDVEKIKYAPYIVLNADGSKSVFILEAYHQKGLYWQGFIIKTDNNRVVSGRFEEPVVEIEYDSGIIIN